MTRRHWSDGMFMSGDMQRRADQARANRNADRREKRRKEKVRRVMLEVMQKGMRLVTHIDKDLEWLIEERILRVEPIFYVRDKEYLYRLHWLDPVEFGWPPRTQEAGGAGRRQLDIGPADTEAKA